MAVKLRWGIFIALLMLVITAGWQVSLAQTVESRYFPETGHWVEGEFLTFFENTPNALQVYGYPITDAYVTNVDPDSPNLRVQYFERARFELHPENPAELRVLLTLLGDHLYELEEPIDPLSLPAGAACRNYETGFQVCYAFLDFFNSYGGIAQFGYPISNLELRDGRLVQYFQRARFEWHPELPSGERVVLTKVGSQYFNYLGEDTHNLMPGDNAPEIVLSIQAHAFVSNPVMATDGRQTVYVIVQDQNLRPVPNSQVIFTLLLPDGKESHYIMPLTNEHGFTSLELTLFAQPYGIAEIFITANHNSFQDQTRTSYRIWW